MGYQVSKYLKLVMILEVLYGYRITVSERKFYKFNLIFYCRNTIILFPVLYFQLTLLLFAPNN